MNFTDIVFYVFAALTVFAAMGVITARNPVNAALFLVLAFCSASGIWMLLEAEFLSIVLVLVYVGAVMVLFLFVVMMLDINLVRLREGFWRWFPFGAGLAGLMVFEMIYVLGSRQTQATANAIVHPANYSNTKELGRLIYTDYMYPFELAAVLLLVAMVAAIALTLRRRVGVKTQNVAEQVQVQAADRVRIVKDMRDGNTQTK
ncbi:MAG: NADH-quinone oxidoreductase subunit J [Gallionella sp.]